MVGTRVGAGHQEAQAIIKTLELSTLFPIFQEGRGLETELMMEHTHVVKPP